MSTIARFVLRHPRKIVGFWVVVLLISGVGATRLSGRVQNGGYAASGSGSIRAGEISEQKFGPARVAWAGSARGRTGRRCGARC
jgi:uncharacterized membrane protein YdfJ with MMPL/SSD domain